MELLRTLEAIVGRSIEIEWLSARKGDPPVLIADATKAALQLNWCPRYSSIERILRTVLEWFEGRKGNPENSNQDYYNVENKN